MQASVKATGRIAPANCDLRRTGCLRSSFVAALLGMATVLLAGCASQGPLRPPTLKLPAPVTRLTAERVGDAVDLQWTTPGKTTDGVSLTGRHGAGTLTAEICRSQSPGDICSVRGTVAVVAGAASSYHDTLPPDLLSGRLRVLHYRVRILNGKGKGAGYVSVDALSGAVPPPVHGLQAAPLANGVALRWQADAAADGTRTMLHVDRIRPAAAGASPSTELHGELLALEPGPHDPGGAMDAGAKPGIEQRYTVYRTQIVHLGAKDLTARSLPATIVVAATAKAPPPLPPTGLEAIVNTLAAPEVDLVWQPSEGAMAYLIFRAEGDGAPVQLTPQPVQSLSYTDAAVRAGAQYRYAVASVDASGTAGRHSPELMETIPQP